MNRTCLVGTFGHSRRNLAVFNGSRPFALFKLSDVLPV
jgi:hypothetical protein